MSVLSDSINSHVDSQTSSQIAVLLPWSLLVLCASIENFNEERITLEI